MTTKIKVYAIAGATASGKTKYAIELAQKIGGEIISADSRMVYKYFNIGTAKPSFEERQGIIHHLIDIIEPEEDYSAGAFYKDVMKLIPEIVSRGNIPIIAGGTGLYFKVLCDNYNLPKVEPNYELRVELENFANYNGAEKLHDMLKQLDIQTALKVHPNNVVRVIRSLEIIKTLGKPLSEVVTKNSDNELFDFELIGLNFENRELLYERINKRVDQMIEMGLLKEVETLLDRYGKIKSLTNTIGYQEFIPFFEKQKSLDETIDKIKQNTRHYAKRQISLLKGLPNLKLINV